VFAVNICRRVMGTKLLIFLVEVNSAEAGSETIVLRMVGSGGPSAAEQQWKHHISDLANWYFLIKI
jgi:hypothetical protein